jgi:hypothetical protein
MHTVIIGPDLQNIFSAGKKFQMRLYGNTGNDF